MTSTEKNTKKNEEFQLEDLLDFIRSKENIITLHNINYTTDIWWF
jgi:hypothetical protein